MFESLASCFASRCSAFAQHDIAVYEMSLIHVPAFCPELFACAPYRKCAQQKVEMIKAAGVVCLALLFLPAGVPAQNQYAGGIVYGPKAAFNIAAPEGWVLDNESGVEQGFHAFFIRKVNPGPMREQYYTQKSPALITRML